MKDMMGETITDTRNVETCTRCGMVANVDPWMHSERYAHAPQVFRNGTTLVFDHHTGTFRAR